MIHEELVAIKKSLIFRDDLGDVIDSLEEVEEESQVLVCVVGFSACQNSNHLLHEAAHKRGQMQTSR